MTLFFQRAIILSRLASRGKGEPNFSRPLNGQKRQKTHCRVLRKTFVLCSFPGTNDRCRTNTDFSRCAQTLLIRTRIFYTINVCRLHDKYDTKKKKKSNKQRPSSSSSFVSPRGSLLIARARATYNARRASNSSRHEWLRFCGKTIRGRAFFQRLLLLLLLLLLSSSFDIFDSRRNTRIVRRDRNYVIRRRTRAKDFVVRPGPGNPKLAYEMFLNSHARARA